MKYIYRNQQTAEILQQWARSGQLIQCSFFFHHRGATAQKSFDGLLQSILRQILQSAPELCQRIPASALPRKSNLNRYTWDLAGLRRTLSWILNQRKFELYICLFIDALDEFDGHLELISEFMASLIGHETEQAVVHCKICFSSRPREIIQDHFQQFPNFRIHDYTKKDIRTYTEGRLLESSDLAEAMSASREEREKVDRVADKIIDQSDGVFLWVRLALDDITKALSQRQIASADELETLLQNIPPELDEFYRSITERIPQDFRWEAYLALDVLLRADERLGLIELYEIITCWPCRTLQGCYEQRQRLLASSKSSPPRNHKNTTRFLQELKDNCGGLLEIDEDEGRMRLMHETVRAFLCKPAFRQLILGQTAIFRPQNGYTELAKFFLARVQYFDHIDLSSFLIRMNKDLDEKRIAETPDLYQKLGEEAAKYCFLSETTTGVCQYEMIESFNPVEPRQPRDGKTSSWFLAPETSGTHFAVVSNLLLYMQRKFQTTEDTSLVDSNAENRLFPHLCRAAMYFGMDDKPRDVNKRFDYGSLARLLIDKGVDQKALIQGVTPFEWLLTRQTRFRYHPHLFRYYPRPGHLGDSVVHVVQALIDAGEDPNLGFCENAKTRKGKEPWKPLHFSSGPMAQMLLERHANVNAKGPRGMTPLDVAIRTYGKHRDHSRLEAPASTLDLFIRNDGLISSTGLKYLPLCMSRLQEDGHDVRNLQGLPQRSIEMKFLSTKDSVMAPVLRAHPRGSRMCLNHCGCCGDDGHEDDDGDSCCEGCCCCFIDEDGCCPWCISTKLFTSCVDDDVENDGYNCCCVM